MQKILLTNRKANFDFEVLERFEAGISLLGHEVKSLKAGGAHFTGTFITINEGEAWVKHFHVPLYANSTLPQYEPERPRKLLLRKAEIEKIAGALSTKGVTVVPLSCGLKNGRVKLEIALVRGKKTYDKRESLKKKDQERQIRTALKYNT